MRRVFPWMVALFLIALPARAETSLFAQPGRFGLGIGSNNLVSGVTGKLYVAPPVALQGTVGFWYGYGVYSGLNLALEAIVEMPSFYRNSSLNLNWNLGGGITAVVGVPAGGGFQAIAGMGLQLKPAPVEFVLELRPTFVFPTGSFFFFGGGIAIRYFFPK